MGASVIEQATAEDLLRMPDDGHRHELVRGEVRTMPPAGHEHGRIAMNIGVSLAQFVRTHGLGAVYAAETGFKIASDPDTVRAPDAAFVSEARLKTMASQRGYWPGAPDLAVEVVSPDDTYVDVQDKVNDWLAAGTRMVIVVNPRRRTVAVHQPTTITLLTENDTLEGGDVVPGWSVPVREVFG
jgi:Uma2 family endonuclease